MAAKKSSQAAKRAQWRKATASVLAQARRDAGKSQEEAATAMGWSRNKQGKLETGRIKVEPGDLIMLSLFYGVDPVVLFRRVVMYLKA